MEVLRRLVIVILWGFILFCAGVFSSWPGPTSTTVIGVAAIAGAGLFLHLIVNWIFAGSKKTSDTKGRSDPDL